jgi:hypothetical protein
LDDLVDPVVGKKYIGPDEKGSRTVRIPADVMHCCIPSGIPDKDLASFTIWAGTS